MKKTLTVLQMVLLALLLSVSCENRGIKPEEAKTRTYSIGDTGPSGGTVFYVNPNYVEGSRDETQCWHYLEAAPADLKVTAVFGYYRKESDGSNRNVGTQTDIGTGKANTKALVEAMGKDAYTLKSGKEKSEYAAWKCDSYVLGEYDDWFLPSLEELKFMYNNLKKAGKGGKWKDAFYVSSSEMNEKMVYFVDFALKGEEDSYPRSYNAFMVRPVRSFV